MDPILYGLETGATPVELVEAPVAPSQPEPVREAA
jgi:hypothetical protein